MPGNYGNHCVPFSLTYPNNKDAEIRLMMPYFVSEHYATAFIIMHPSFTTFNTWKWYTEKSIFSFPGFTTICRRYCTKPTVFSKWFCMQKDNTDIFMRIMNSIQLKVLLRNIQFCVSPCSKCQYFFLYNRPTILIHFVVSLPPLCGFYSNGCSISDPALPGACFTFIQYLNTSNTQFNTKLVLNCVFTVFLVCCWFE